MQAPIDRDRTYSFDYPEIGRIRLHVYWCGKSESTDWEITGRDLNTGDFRVLAVRRMSNVEREPRAILRQPVDGTDRDWQSVHPKAGAALTAPDVDESKSTCQPETEISGLNMLPSQRYSHGCVFATRNGLSLPTSEGACIK